MLRSCVNVFFGSLIRERAVGATSSPVPSPREERRLTQTVGHARIAQGGITHGLRLTGGVQTKAILTQD